MKQTNKQTKLLSSQTLTQSRIPMSAAEDVDVIQGHIPQFTQGGRIEIHSLRIEENMLPKCLIVE